MNVNKQKTIILIACSSKKFDNKMKAENLYKKSNLFRSSLEYAKSIQHDKIYILSAKYHLLDLNNEIESYNETLSYISPKKRKHDLIVLDEAKKIEWGKKVIDQLGEISDLNKDIFIFLAGRDYLKPIESSIKHIDNRLKGLNQGQRTKWLKNNKN